MIDETREIFIFVTGIIIGLMIYGVVDLLNTSIFNQKYICIEKEEIVYHGYAKWSYDKKLVFSSKTKKYYFQNEEKNER